MSKTTYDDYINSATWRAVREEAFKIHGRECCKCKSKRRLHVHHKTYKRLTKEWVDIDLVPLCESCHDKCHRFCSANNLDLWHGTEKFLLGDAISKKEETRRINKSKLTRKQRRALKKKNRLNREIGPMWRTRDVPMEVQLARVTAKTSTPPKEKKPPGINVQKFMDMYGIDEETARSFL